METATSNYIIDCKYAAHWTKNLQLFKLPHFNLLGPNQKYTCTRKYICTNVFLFLRETVIHSCSIH